MAHQVSPGGYINYYNEPAFQLAVVEHVAEEQSDHDLAAHALAGWALCSAYPVYHLEAPGHPLVAAALATIGPDPPWKAAETVLRSGDWQRAWANKQYLGPDPVVELLHEVRRAWETS